MKSGDFKRLVSVENLMLAWKRVSTAENHSYKRFFRQVFYAYEFASVQNIQDLHARLTGGSFEPISPSRLFVPKGAGLNRSITLLHVEDQILLQAIANILAESVRKRREIVEGKVVFSNLLNVDDKSIFFLQSWRNCYRQYLDQISRVYTHGYKWVAHFDLAAYYDTISHELLLKTVYPKTKLGPNAETICGWLKHWITPRKTWPLQHGIPQGPQSSDFLAEIFLLPIDEAMLKKPGYVRYVDDIRLFGKTEFEVQDAVQELESLCRDRGLIPQGKKFAIVELKSLRDALGNLPSIASGSDQSVAPALTEAQAVKYFRSTLSGRPLRVTEKSRMRYVLFHGPASTRIRNWVLQLMQHHPEHTEAFAAYLRQFRRSERVVKACIELLRKTPSSFIKGELLQLLTKWVYKSEANAILPIAKNLAKSKDAGVVAKWGAMSFLCRAEALGRGQFSNFVLTQRGLVQSLTIAQLPDDTYGSMLSGTHPFPTNHPHIAVPFDAANRRRNKLDSSHPYDSKTGIRNSALTKREQLALVAQLRRAFEELINLCGLHGIH